MNQTVKHIGIWTGPDGAERRRVEAVVETLAELQRDGETLAAVAHDARNMVTALDLYCDLLDGPGVLAAPFAHYGSELRLVAAASRRLVEKLVVLDRQAPRTAGADGRTMRRVPPAAAPTPVPMPIPIEDRWDVLPTLPIANLAEELIANRNLLAALAGPAVAVTVDAEGAARSVRLTAEDLTRILVNLVKNAAEAMPAGGRIRIALRELPAVVGTAEWLSLAVEDSGPGIPPHALERIFDAGYTTRTGAPAPSNGWPAAHRGLGLAITRSIVEAAGGRIFAANRPESGARLVIELPVWRR